jgi:shikimate dehydrogenase
LPVGKENYFKRFLYYHTASAVEKDKAIGKYKNDKKYQQNGAINNKIIMKRKRFAVFGSPIIHSFSPQIYQQLFNKNNVDWKYNRILTDNPETIIKFIKEFNLNGANITAPLKKTIIPYITNITADAKHIDAVNTIIKHNNSLLGFNTDWEGVLIALRDYYISKSIEFNLNDKNILVIGAGNAASAVFYGIKKTFPNSEIDILNRNIDKSRYLAKKYDLNYLNTHNINSILLEKYDVIIVTIPEPEKYFYKTEFFPRTLLFFANYSNYNYFDKLKQEHKKIILGNEWLKHQAISAFEYFYGYDEYCKEIKLTPIRIKKEFNKLQNKTIFLTGFSGAGKTFIGKKIADALNRPFYDLDKMIEKYFNENISNIFENKGERKFREYETKILSKLKNEKCVVALGGGTIIEQRNLKYIDKGFVVYLYSDLEISIARIDITTRPMLTNKTLTEIEKLFKERKFIYFDNSDIVIESSDNSIDTIINELSMVFSNNDL